ncbi:MAG TPA: GNAT family N-acetyltransferase [Bryobacteraceae bacterium]|nr:GNAT family N-acetyltransferase [Bryobacteraceae bacterium]
MSSFAKQTTSLFRRLKALGDEIRPLRESDLAFLSAIQSTSPEAAQWKPEDYLRFDAHVAVRRGMLAGFIVSRPIAEGEREILNLAVHPDFRRRGIATSLIEAELRRWPGDHFLEVRESNTPARNLYRGLGFREAGVRPGYYESPPEPGIVMRFFS